MMTLWSPGDLLGPYELIAPLGAGGMGEVWKARDTRVDRIVAIKRLKAEHAERLTREARAIAALNHPHICQLFDVGPDYLVMEYIQGDVLRGPMPVAEAVRVGSQIASALVAAHRKGIVHRDLKPANVLIGENGAKLLDFGLARTEGPPLSGDEETVSTSLSESGVLAGTLAYMSPEQAQGRPIDSRSDMFSFGAVLYELMSGRRAFGRETPLATLSAVVNEAPLPLEASTAIGRIVDRCLAKQPHDRFPSMAEVAAALDRQSLPITSDDQRSIAVLPFANLSRDPDDEYFSDGLAEELIHLLARVPNLKVAARTSSFAFRNKEQDVRRIAGALGVETVLEGSVRRSGRRIRVTAQLINAGDGYHLWSERYDRELTDVFAIQDDISQAIAGALQRSLTPRSTTHTPNLAAYDALLRARHELRRYAPDTFASAREHCAAAIALDSSYAAPHALLGFIHLQATTHAGRPMPEVAAVIRREANRALELDASNTDAHFLLGAVEAFHDYNWKEGSRSLLTALATSSVPAEAHWAYACVLSTFARFEESSSQMRQAVQKEPHTVLWRGVLMAHLVCGGWHEEALREGERALAVSSNEIHPHLAIAEANLALGRIEAALSAAEAAYRNLPQQSMGSGFLAAILARVGQTHRAAALVNGMGESPSPIWGRAWYHLLCSEVDQAAHWYEKMIETREIFAPVYAHSPYTQELRASAHWPRLARMMNLPESIA